MRRNIEGFDDFWSSFCLFTNLRIQYFVLSCEWQNVFFKVRETQLLYTIVLLNWKLFAIIEFAIHSEPICQTFELFPILKKIAGVQDLLRIPHCLDRLHRIEAFTLFLLEFEHQYVSLLLLLCHLFFELIEISFEIFEL